NEPCLLGQPFSQTFAAGRRAFEHMIGGGRCRRGMSPLSEPYSRLWLGSAQQQPHLSEPPRVISVGCRRFESCCPDHLPERTLVWIAINLGMSSPMTARIYKPARNAM